MLGIRFGWERGWCVCGVCGIIEFDKLEFDELSDITNVGTKISTHDMGGLRKYEKHQKNISYSWNY